MTAGVYRIYCSGNNTFYVGESCDIEKRLRGGHFKEMHKGIHDNRHMQRSWNKYGPESFSFDVVWVADDAIIDVLNYEDLGMLTRRMEATIGYAMIENGFSLFNLRDFSYWREVSPMLTPAIREKSSASLRSEQTRRKSSESAIRRRSDPAANALINSLTQAPGAILKRSASLKAYWRTPESRMKRAAYWDGDGARKIQSEKMRDLLSRPETQKKMKAASEEKSRKVICMETGIIFNSVKGAADHLGFSSQAVISSIKRKGKCGGLTWKYI